MIFINKHYRLLLFLLGFISFALHFHVFNRDLVGIHVWRQTQTQNVINNFYRDDFNILNPHINAFADTDRILRLEFPIMQWIFALFYKMFGPHIVISRALSFIIGLCSIWGMFRLCDSIFKNKGVATICAWCFNFSPLFYYYTVNPMPDNLATCCAIWSISLFYSYIATHKIKYAAWSAFFLCIATLAKLPFVLYGAFMVAFVFLQFKRKEYSGKELGKLCFLFFLTMLPAVCWYAAVIPHWATSPVITGLFDPTITLSGIWDLVFGNLTSVLPELLLNYGSVLFFIAGLYFMYHNKASRANKFLLFVTWGIAILLYFIFEINAICFVHDYYMLPFLPILFLIVAYGAKQLLSTGNKFLKVFSLICLCVLPVTAFIRADARWNTSAPGFAPAFYKYKNELRALTPPNALCVVGSDESDQILLYYIDRKGWRFSNDDLTGDQLAFYISKGAKYLFINDHVDEHADIKVHLGDKIFDKDDLRVYKLKQ